MEPFNIKLPSTSSYSFWLNCVWNHPDPWRHAQGHRYCWGSWLRSTTGTAFQTATEVCLLPYRNSICCLPRAGFTPLSPEWKPKQSAIQNLSKHKSKCCLCRYAFLQFLISVFPSSRLVPHDFLFSLFPFPRFGHHRVAPAVPVRAYIVRLGGHSHVLCSLPQQLISFLSLPSPVSLFFYSPSTPVQWSTLFFPRQEEMNRNLFVQMRCHQITKHSTGQDGNLLWSKEKLLDYLKE